jgi:hypothetical protein
MFDQFNDKLMKYGCPNDINGDIQHSSKFGSLSDDLTKTSVKRWMDFWLPAMYRKSFIVCMPNSKFIFAAQFMGFHSSFPSHYSATTERAP